jgi:hypothetical protein
MNQVACFSFMKSRNVVLSNTLLTFLDSKRSLMRLMIFTRFRYVMVLAFAYNLQFIRARNYEEDGETFRLMGELALT